MLPQSSQEAIQVATVEAGGSPKSSECEEFNICSPKALCGPHPKKVTIVVALILSIWASFILGINIHKKVFIEIVEKHVDGYLRTFFSFQRS